MPFDCTDTTATAVTIAAAAIVPALKRVAAVVEARNSIPVLSNVLLQVGGGVLTMTATNLDIEATASVAVDGGADWSASVPARDLLAYLRKAPKGADVQLRFSQDDDPRLVASYGHTANRFPVIAADNFPAMKAPAVSVQAMTDGAALGAALAAVAPYMSKEAVRYYLNGAYLHAQDGVDGVRIVATDGHRVTFRDLPMECDGPFPGALIPRAAVAWLVKHVDLTGPVFLDVGTQALRITTDAGIFQTKLIDGAFPDYARLVGETGEPGLTVKVADLREAVELMRAVYIREVREREVTLHLDGGELVLSARDICGGADGSTAIDAAAADGAELKMTILSKLLLEALKAFPKGGEVTLSPRGPMLHLRCGALEATLAPRKTVVALAQPEVTFSAPQDSNDPGYVVYTKRTIDGPAHRQTFTFADIQTATRAYRQHVKAARRSGAVVTAPKLYAFTYLTRAQLADMNRRASAVWDAEWTFSETAEGDIPWTRKVLDKADALRFGPTPAATINNRSTKAMIAYARKAMGIQDTIEAPPPPMVEIPAEILAADPAPSLEAAPCIVVDLAAEREKRRAPVERERWRMATGPNAALMAIGLHPDSVRYAGDFIFLRVA